MPDLFFFVPDNISLSLIRYPIQSTFASLIWLVNMLSKDEIANLQITNAFNRGEVDSVLAFFNVNKEDLEKAIKNQKLQLDNKNNELKKLLTELLDENNDKAIDLKKIVKLFTVENLINLNLDNDNAQDRKLSKQFEDSFLSPKTFFLNGIQPQFTPDGLRKYVHTITSKVVNNLNNYIKSNPGADLNSDFKIQNKSDLIFKLSNADRMALTLYTNEDFFKLANALLYGNTKKVNQLIEKTLIGQGVNINSIDENELKNRKNAILKESIITTLFCISALNKSNTNEITYTFRGELSCPSNILQQRIHASKQHLTTEQCGLLSANINRPADTFNDGLAGSVATLVVGQRGLDISPFSLVNNEKECVFGPTHLSWLYKSVPADIQFHTFDGDLNQSKDFLLEKLGNSIIYSEQDKNLYFTDVSTNQLVNIKNKKIPADKSFKQIIEESTNLSQLIEESKKSDVILSPELLKQYFGTISTFEPKKHFFLAVPTPNDNSVFELKHSKVSLGAIIGLALGALLAIGLIASGVLMPLGPILGVILLSVLVATTVLGSTVGFALDKASSVQPTPKVSAVTSQSQQISNQTFAPIIAPKVVDAKGDAVLLSITQSGDDAKKIATNLINDPIISSQKPKLIHSNANNFFPSEKGIKKQGKVSMHSELDNALSSSESPQRSRSSSWWQADTSPEKDEEIPTQTATIV